MNIKPIRSVRTTWAFGCLKDAAGQAERLVPGKMALLSHLPSGKDSMGFSRTMLSNLLNDKETLIWNTTAGWLKSLVVTELNMTWSSVLNSQRKNELNYIGKTVHCIHTVMTIQSKREKPNFLLGYNHPYFRSIDQYQVATFFCTAQKHFIRCLYKMIS